ncbi:MAG: hypothetical protein ACTSQY_10465 [Candidatus Odinarchaeia archaeon]
MILLTVLVIVANISQIITVFGSMIILSTIILLAICLVLGYALGGPKEEIKVILSLTTVNRSSAMVF